MVKWYTAIAALAPLLSAPVAFADDLLDQEHAIRKVIEQYGHARNELRDPKLMASYFSEDADVRNTSGAFTKGRTAIEQDFRQVLYANAGRLSAVTVIDSVRFVDKNVAIVDLTNEWRSTLGGAPSGWTISTLVMKRDGKQWRIVSSRTSPATGAALSLAENHRSATGEGTRARTAAQTAKPKSSPAPPQKNPPGPLKAR